MNDISKWSLVLGPCLGMILCLLLYSIIGFAPAITAGITLWVAIWWILEPIPIPATSIIPFFAFPMSGIISNKSIAQAYGHWLILLLMSGFILSKGMEQSGLHRRIAHHIMHLIGSDSPKRIMLGVMVSTAFISAWISNTATCLMMLPIVIALSQNWTNNAQKTILLSLAYSASIGGMATPIGTPPNIILMGIYEETTQRTISFIDWMYMAIPITIALLVGTWLYLSKEMTAPSESHTPKQIEINPSASTHERRFLLLFLCTALAWITRTQPLGGWSSWIAPQHIGDDTVGLMAVVLMFLIPSGTQPQKALLDWETAQKIPWGLLLLFGGGIAIAKAFSESGLSQIIGQQLTQIETFPLLFMIGIICLCVTFLTEITSNTATTTLLMPILAATAVSLHIDPILLMLPAALSASCAFMLPVATAPNAIVFGTDVLTTKDMAKTGFAINLIGVLIITSAMYLFLS